jgi:hypothetical protein
MDPFRGVCQMEVRHLISLAAKSRFLIYKLHQTHSRISVHTDSIKRIKSFIRTDQVMTSLDFLWRAEVCLRVIIWRKEKVNNCLTLCYISSDNLYLERHLSVAQRRETDTEQLSARPKLQPVERVVPVPKSHYELSDSDELEVRRRFNNPLDKIPHRRGGHYRERDNTPKTMPNLHLKVTDLSASESSRSRDNVKEPHIIATYSSVLNYFPELIARVGRATYDRFTRTNDTRLTFAQQEKLRAMLSPNFEEWIQNHGVPDLFYTKGKEGIINLATLQRMNLCRQQKHLAGISRSIIDEEYHGNSVAGNRTELRIAMEDYGIHSCSPIRFVYVSQCSNSRYT